MLQVSRLHPPRRGRGLLSRPRLEDLAPRLLEHGLAIIQAPPGYGKTTLAAAWLEILAAQGVATAWLTLDHADDSPAGLLHGLATSLGVANPDLAPDLPAPEHSPSVNAMAVCLSNALHRHTGHILLVLDDCQHAGASTLQEALAPLLRHPPPRLHLLLVSRRQLPTNLLSQAREHPLLALDAESLRFTSDETQALLERAGQTPTASELTTIQETSAGWSTALRAYLLVARKRSHGGSAALSRRLSMVFDAMLTELDTDFRRQLLPLGLLETFNAPLLAHCRYHAPERFIDALEQRQLFIGAQGDERSWFNLHPLFRQHMTRLLEHEDPERANAFRRRAAAWLAEQGCWRQAISLALAAGDAHQAHVWIQQCAMDLVEQGDFLNLLQWQRQLKAQPGSFSARTRLALAWAAALAMQHEEASALLESLPDEDGIDPWECRALRAMLMALNEQADEGAQLAAACLQHFGDQPWILNVLNNVQRYAMLRASQWHALYDLPSLQSKPLASTCYTFNRLYQHCIDSLADIQQAHLTSAAAHIERAFAELAESGATNPNLRAFPSGFLARIRLLQGRINEAEALLADSLAFVQMGGFLDSIMASLGSSAALLRRQGQLAQARQRVEEIEAIAHRRQWPRLLAQALLERSRISLQELKPEEARACVLRLQQLCSKHCQTAETDDIAHARVLAMLELASATGEPPTALISEAEALAARLGAAQLRLPQMELHIAMIGLLCRMGQTDAAERKYNEWQPAVRQSGALALLESLPARWRLTAAPAPARGSPLHALTVKERLILQCVARGESNKVMAKALGVTPETIKSHLKNIFSKLNVRNRTQAAAFASSGVDENIPMP
ncbi:LuxR C-terminal-related transcriptional regulator [Sterolibacterium denitrificans]|uniref:LuxR C-terminal-related transcriptional regulator n=1 Tax=Sterolibacterium denitrificans TaxID=157592 RepID=UPI00156271D5|nr:LuxR C-terminal-related transcriptional regulator [Sterolibacterium denitrificans]